LVWLWDAPVTAAVPLQVGIVPGPAVVGIWDCFSWSGVLSRACPLALVG